MFDRARLSDEERTNASAMLDAISGSIKWLALALSPECATAPRFAANAKRARQLEQELRSEFVRTRAGKKRLRGATAEDEVLYVELIHREQNAYRTLAHWMREADSLHFDEERIVALTVSAGSQMHVMPLELTQLRMAIEQLIEAQPDHVDDEERVALVLRLLRRSPDEWAREEAREIEHLARRNLSLEMHEVLSGLASVVKRIKNCAERARNDLDATRTLFDAIAANIARVEKTGDRSNWALNLALERHDLRGENGRPIAFDTRLKLVGSRPDE
jgi:hypothetical protein